MGIQKPTSFRKTIPFLELCNQNGSCHLLGRGVGSHKNIHIEKLVHIRRFKKETRGIRHFFKKYINKKGNSFTENCDPKEYDLFYMSKKTRIFWKLSSHNFMTLWNMHNMTKTMGTLLQCETGKIYTMKESKEVEKAKLCSRFPRISNSRHFITWNEWFKLTTNYIESEFCKKNRFSKQGTHTLILDW